RTRSARAWRSSGLAGILVFHRRVVFGAAVRVLLLLLRLPRVLGPHPQPEKFRQFEVVTGILGDLPIGTAQALAIAADGLQERPRLIAATLDETVCQAEQGSTAARLGGPLGTAPIVILGLAKATRWLAGAFILLVQRQPIESGRLVVGDLPRIGGTVLGLTVELDRLLIVAALEGSVAVAQQLLDVGVGSGSEQEESQRRGQQKSKASHRDCPFLVVG